MTILRGGDDLPHVPEGVADEFGGMEGPGVIDVDRQRRDLEDVVVKAHQGLVRPDAQSPVLGEAVAADPRAGEDHVAVGRADLDRLDHLDQVHAVALRKEAPFVQEGEDRRPVGVLHDLAGFALDRAVQDGQGKLLHVQDLGEEGPDPFAGGVVDPAADPPEVPDGGHVLPARHDPLIGVGEEGVRWDAALLEGLFHDRIGDVFRRPRGHGRLDEDEAIGPDLLADDLQALFQGGDLRMALAAVPQGLLEVVALDVHHDHVGKAEGIVGEGGGQGLLFVDAAGDEGGHLGVFRLHRGDPAVQVGDLPEGAGGGTLHADDKLVGLAGLFVDRIGDDPGHDRPDKADAHDDDDLTFFPALGGDEAL